MPDEQKPNWVVKRDQDFLANRLSYYEDKLLKAVKDVGAALKAIRDEDLYKVDGRATFEEYCKEKLGMSRGRAYQLINAENIRLSLADQIDDEAVMENVNKMSESQFRAVARIEPERRAEVVLMAAANEVPSSKKIEALAAQTGAITASKLRPPKQKEKQVCPKCGECFEL